MIDHLAQGCTCAGQQCPACQRLLCRHTFLAKRGRLLKNCPDCRAAKRKPRSRAKRKPRTPITAERLEQLRAMPYAEYLKSPEWYRRRAVVLKFAAARCQICYSDKPPLNVHHRTYERLGHEQLSDMILLCQECHALFHHYRKLQKAAP